MMKPSLVNHFFYSFTFLIFWFFIDELSKLNYNPDFESSLLLEQHAPILVVCFQLNLDRNDCNFLDEKVEFTCELQHQLGCHTKGLNNIRRKYVTSLIKKCKLEKRLLDYDNETIKPKTFLHKEKDGDQFCLIFDHENFFYKTARAFIYSFKREFNQDFYIYLLRTRDELLRKPIFHRKCFIDSTRHYSCREANIDVNIAKIIRKNHIKATKCIKYGHDSDYKDFSNQNECLLSCYSRHRANLTKKVRKKCVETICPLPDCEEVQYYIDAASDSDDPDVNTLMINSQIILTEVIDVLNFESLFKYVIGIMSSLFGFNFLNQSLKMHSFVQRSVFDVLANKKIEDADKQKKVNTLKKYSRYVRISFFIIANLICTFQLSQSVFRYFRFDMQHSFHYDFNVSMTGDRLTVSICFDLNDIFINDLKPDNLSIFTFEELSEFTLESNELIESIILKTASLDKEIIDENSTKLWFIHGDTKCFDYEFRLQEIKLDFFLRISQMQVKTFRNFKHIYVRKSGTRPVSDQAKQLHMQLGLKAVKTRRSNLPFNRKCKHYRSEIDGCKSRKGCLELCQRNMYVDGNRNYLAPNFIVTRNDLKNKTIAKLKFSSKYIDESQMRMLRNKCRKSYPLSDCRSVDYYNLDSHYGEKRIPISNSTLAFFQLYIFSETDTFNYKYNWSDLVLSLINILSLWIGFQIPLMIDVLIKMIRKFLGNNFFLICLRYLLLTCTIVLFLIHLKSFISLIKQDQKSVSMHLLEAKENYIPRFSLCFKYGQSNPFRNLTSLKNFTPNEILKRTSSIDELINEIMFYDSDFNEIIINKNNVSDYLYFGSRYTIMTSNHYKFRNGTKTKKLFKIKPFLIHESKCFEFIILFKYNLIDYRLKKNPHLFIMRPDFNNKSFDKVLILISNFDRIKLENWHPFAKNDHLELTYKRLKIIFNDNLFYIKNPLELFKRKTELNQMTYFSFIHDKFFSKHNRTTTIVPLYELKYYDTKIDNDLFKEFYLNFSKDEDYYLQKDYIRITNHYTSNRFVNVIKLIDQNQTHSILKLHPYFLKFNLIISNKLTIPELILYFTLILNLYLAVVFVEVPYFVSDSYLNLIHIQSSFFAFLKKFFTLLKAFKFTLYQKN